MCISYGLRIEYSWVPWPHCTFWMLQYPRIFSFWRTGTPNYYDSVFMSRLISFYSSMYLYIKSRILPDFLVLSKFSCWNCRSSLGTQTYFRLSLVFAENNDTWRVKQEPRKRDAPAGYGQSYTCKKGKNR